MLFKRIVSQAVSLLSDLSSSYLYPDPNAAFNPDPGFLFNPDPTPGLCLWPKKEETFAINFSKRVFLYPKMLQRQIPLSL